MIANLPRTQTWLIVMSLWLTFGNPIIAQDIKGQSLAELKGKAIQEAVKKVQGSIIRLDIFSSQDNAPTVGTAVVVSADGDMITSSHFVDGPDTQLIANIVKKKMSAKIVGIDHNRRICQLKIENVSNLKFLKLNKTNCRVGETTIAIGHAYDQESVNVSLGVLSGKNRIWGKAIQTDAKIGPANYGGPLINLKGQMIGIITSISPDDDGGNHQEWYDSGIGFAIPTEGLLDSIRRVSKLGNITRGLLGIRFKSDYLFDKSLVVSSCFPRSPAAVAGIEPNDQIVNVNGNPVRNLSQFKFATNKLYSGDMVQIEIKRGSVLKRFSLSLVEKLSVYRFPYLGFIPRRSFEGSGVYIDQVDQKGPSKGRMQAGDIISEIDGTPIENLNDLQLVLSKFEEGQSIEVKVDRGPEKKMLTVDLGKLAEDVQPESFPTQPDSVLSKTIKKQTLRVNGHANRCELFVSDDIANIRKLIVIPAKSSKEKSGELGRLTDLAGNEGIAILVAYPDALGGWQIQEKELLKLAVQKARSQLPQIDYGVILARDKIFELAAILVNEHRSFYRGMVCVRAVGSHSVILPLADPGRPLFLLIIPDKSTMSPSMKLGRQLSENGLAVRILNGKQSTMTDPKLSLFQRWLFLLDRM